MDIIPNNKLRVRIMDVNSNFQHLSYIYIYNILCLADLSVDEIGVSRENNRQTASH